MGTGSIDFENTVAVLASTLYAVTKFRVSVRRAFARACAEHGCGDLAITREELFQLAKDFVSRYYEVKRIAERCGRVNPSFKSLSRLYLHLRSPERGLRPSSKLKKAVGRDCPLLGKVLEEPLEPWARLSYPRWLYEDLVGLLGVHDAEKLLEAMNKRTYWIRVNTLKVDVDKALEALREEGVVCEEDRNVPFMVKVISAKKPLRTLRLFKEGAIVPQDKASALVVLALKPEPGMVVYDYAAAPGVKTSLVMQYTENNARVVAVDISPRRLEAMKNLLKLYGVNTSRVTLILADSTALQLNNRADAALLDAPCSSSGAVSKDPAIKLFLQSKDVVYRVKGLQVELLYNALKQVPSLVYATCSILPEEGEEVVEEVAKRGVEHGFVDARIPAHRGYTKYRVGDKVYRTLPHVDMCEGFFIARFEK